MSIPFIDLQAQRARIADRVNAAVLSVIESGRYILGPEVTEFEQQLAASRGRSTASPAPTAPTPWSCR
jgi:dTDP-4-amino-4,6-dideoxygalactose transaminase